MADYFTASDYTRRLERAIDSAQRAGLAGVLVGPGPDLTWLCGYRPPAVTERLTLLVLTPERPPTLIVPALERVDAAAAAGSSALTPGDWGDGVDPYAVAAGLLRPDGRYGVSDSTWALHLLGLQGARPGTSYAALSDALPMLRAIKDEAELERLALAG